MWPTSLDILEPFDRSRFQKMGKTANGKFMKDCFIMRPVSDTTWQQLPMTLPSNYGTYGN